MIKPESNLNKHVFDPRFREFLVEIGFDFGDTDSRFATPSDAQNLQLIATDGLQMTPHEAVRFRLMFDLDA